MSTITSSALLCTWERRETWSYSYLSLGIFPPTLKGKTSQFIKHLSLLLQQNYFFPSNTSKEHFKS